MSILLDVTKEATPAISLNVNKVSQYIIELSWESKHDLDGGLIALSNGRLDGDFDRVLSTFNPNMVLQSDTTKNISRGSKYPFQNKASYLFHSGDVLDGTTVSGVDETAIFDVDNAPSTVNGVAIVLGIYPPNSPTNQSALFGEVKNAKVVIKTNERTLLEANLTSDFNDADTVKFGTIEFVNNDWKFNPNAIGVVGGINEILKGY